MIKVKHRESESDLVSVFFVTVKRRLVTDKIDCEICMIYFSLEGDYMRDARALIILEVLILGGVLIDF